MARAPHHIQQRGTVWLYRRRVPADVQHGPFFGGKEYYQTSLRTTDVQAAKRKAVIVALQFDAEVEAMRAISLVHQPLVSGRDYVLTTASIEVMQAEWWEDEVDRDRRNRQAADAEPEGEWAARLEALDDVAHYDLAQLNDPHKGREALSRLRREVRADISAFAVTRAKQRGILLGSSDHRRIEEALVVAQIDVLKARHSAWCGIEVEPTSASVARGRNKSERPQANWTLRKLSEWAVQDGSRGLSWKGKVDQVVTLFEGFVGSPQASSEITKDDVIGFVDLMLECPDRCSMRFPGRSAVDAIRLNRARDKPFGTLAPNTVRDTHFAVLRSLLGEAGRKGWLENVPTAGLKVPGARKKGGTRTSFKPDELNDLFELPLFTGCRHLATPGVPGPILINDHRFWVPLIMLFSGARPSELGQLAVSDIKLDATTPYISILTEFDEKDPDDRPFVVSFKTSNARREIPIHPKLLELGFAEYVRSVPQGAHVRLFPNWPLSADPRKLFSGASWIRRFNDTYIPSITSRHPKPTFYSLRHTFKGAMAANRVDRAVQNQVLGHANVGMDAHYYDGVSLEVLHEQLSPIVYPHLALDHLARNVSRA